MRKGKKRGGRNWVGTELGFEMFVDVDYQPTDGSDPYSTWFARCARCKRGKQRRITEMHTARQGSIEPLAYLHVWAGQPCPPGKSHARAVVPLQDAVDAIAVAPGNADKYRAIIAMFGS